MTEQANSFVQKAVDNLWLTFTGRLAMILCALMLPAGGWALTQVWSSYQASQDRIDQKLDGISRQLADQNTDYRLLKADQANFMTYTNDRFARQGERVGKIENDVEGLKQRIYAYPAPTPSQQPEQKAREKWQRP